MNIKSALRPVLTVVAGVMLTHAIYHYGRRLPVISTLRRAA